MFVSSAVDIERGTCECDQSNVSACSILFIFIFIQVVCTIKGGFSISSTRSIHYMSIKSDSDHDIMQPVPSVQQEQDGTKQKEMRGVTNRGDTLPQLAIK